MDQIENMVSKDAFGRKILMLGPNLKHIDDIKGIDDIIDIDYIDLSNNHFSHIPDFSSYPNLEMISGFYMRSNRLKNMNSNLKFFSRLEFLDLSCNKIQHIENLEGLPLRRLIIDHAAIRRIEGLEPLRDTLVSLSLTSNFLTEIEGLESLYNLQELYLSDNEIASLNGIEHLLKLQELYLDDNPVDIYRHENAGDIVNWVREQRNLESINDLCLFKYIKEVIDVERGNSISDFVPEFFQSVEEFLKKATPHGFELDGNHVSISKEGIDFLAWLDDHVL